MPAYLVSLRDAADKIGLQHNRVGNQILYFGYENTPIQITCSALSTTLLISFIARPISPFWAGSKHIQLGALPMHEGRRQVRLSFVKDMTQTRRVETCCFLILQLIWVGIVIGNVARVVGKKKPWRSASFGMEIKYRSHSQEWRTYTYPLIRTKQLCW